MDVITIEAIGETSGFAIFIFLRKKEKENPFLSIEIMCQCIMLFLRMVYHT